MMDRLKIMVGDVECDTEEGWSLVSATEVIAFVDVANQADKDLVRVLLSLSYKNVPGHLVQRDIVGEAIKTALKKVPLGAQSKIIAHFATKPGPIHRSHSASSSASHSSAEAREKPPQR